MGIYLNPQNEGFTEAIHSRIYVDKTGRITHTNAFLGTNEKYICVSRPRRFGKSMTLHMLAAYYSKGRDSGKLFKGKNIETDKSFETHLNKYDVILLNMQQFLTGAKRQNVTEYLEQEVPEELLDTYGACVKNKDAGQKPLFPIKKLPKNLKMP